MYGDGGINDYDHDSYLESLGISVTPLLPVVSPNLWGEVLQGNFYSADTAGTDNPLFAHTTHPHSAPSGALEEAIWTHYPIAPERASPPTSPLTSRPSPSQVPEAAAPADVNFTTRLASSPTSPSTSCTSPCQVLEAAAPANVNFTTQLASPPTPSTCSLFPCLQSGCESRPPFNSPKLLQNHVRRSHKPRNAVCLVCGKRFVYQTDVRKQHNVNAHTDLPALPAWVPKQQQTRIIVRRN